MRNAKTASTKPGHTKRSVAKRSLTADELFFYEHGGYSYDPKRETANGGRVRCAREMARAEREARERDWEYRWEDDWEVGSHIENIGGVYEEDNREPQTCETCLLIDSDGTVLESLGCIDDADSNYRRVVEAELALEALAREERKRDEERKIAAMMHL